MLSQISECINEMKLSVTDKFLWDIYTILEKTDDVVNFILNPHPGKWGSLLAVENPIFEKYRHDKNREKFKKLLYYAKTSGYIRVKNLEGKKAIMLTREGINKVLKARFLMEGKQKRKDGKWTMLIFDVPEKYRKSRNLLRGILHNLGYKLFQQSVWITPYDVSEKTEKLLQMYNLDEFVKIFLIEEI
ncbi:MAG: repressor [Parcubacteria group bacterium GW2011_GWA2_33_14]|nr:MAG: repressor [Parcubacteria group bacterium GW2011_GWA2_33_14]